MNLYEKLNRLDDSLVESKRVVKKKKLTESELTPWEKIVKTFPNDFGHLSTRSANRAPAQHKTMNDYARDPNTTTYDNKEVTTKPKMSARDKLLKTFPDLDIRLDEGYSNEMTEFMNWIQEYRNGALWNDFATEFEAEEDPDISVVLSWLENFDNDAYYDYVDADTYDDDIDEMLVESTEQYELSTLVKDSINHLVNDLGKDSMADDFGDDVCADLENNYDIDVPQNPVKYADWCDAVMSEVSRQLNNKEEQLTEALKGPGYAIKVWENPESAKKGMPTFDSIKKNKLYPDFDAVIKALQSSELSELGAYEILWVKSGQEI